MSIKYTYKSRARGLAEKIEKIMEMCSFEIGEQQHDQQCRNTEYSYSCLEQFSNLILVVKEVQDRMHLDNPMGEGVPSFTNPLFLYLLAITFAIGAIAVLVVYLRLFCGM
jgi:hypothetical protein